MLDPQNDCLTEDQKAERAQMRPRTFRRWKTPDLIDEVIALRRAQYNRHILAVDAAMIKQAMRGSLPHAELFYERTEGYVRRSPKHAVEMGIQQEVWDVVGVKYREQLADVLAQALRTRHERAASCVESAPDSPRDPVDSAHLPPPPFIRNE